jgi:hypothetical protein
MDEDSVFSGSIIRLKRGYGQIHHIQVVHEARDLSPREVLGLIAGAKEGHHFYLHLVDVNAVSVFSMK